MNTSANIEPELTSLRTKLAIEIENDTKQMEVIKKRIIKNTTLLNAVKGSLGMVRPETKATGYGSRLRCSETQSVV